MLEALTQIAPALDTAALLARVHVAPGSEDAAAVTALIDQAREVARPKALYAEAFLEDRGDDTIRIAGITFTSPMLRRKLDTVERVFPYVATCGHEMDGVPLPEGDVLVQFWWDAITEEDFQTCQVCHRDTCPNRRAPFDAAVWQSLRES